MSKFSSKGISPLIAAVLLIAFTMAIASIFAQWAPQLMDDATGDTQERAAEIQDCTQIQMEIVDVDDENETAQDVTVRQTAGSAGAGLVSVSWFYDDGGPVQETTFLGEDDDFIEDNTDEEDPTRDDLSDEDFQEMLDNNPRDSITLTPDEDEVGNTLEQVSLDPVDCEGAGTTSWSR